MAFPRNGYSFEGTKKLVEQLSCRREEVTVTVITDKDVKYIIRHKGTVRRGTSNLNSTPSKGTKNQLHETLNNVDEIAELEKEELPSEYLNPIRKPSALASDDGPEDLAVGFQTPKKRQSMLLKARTSASKFTTPTKTALKNTPLKTPNQRMSQSGGHTPTYRTRSQSRLVDGTPGRRSLLLHTPKKNFDSSSAPNRKKLRDSKTSSVVFDVSALKTPCGTRKSSKRAFDKIQKSESSDEESSSEEDSSEDSSTEDTNQPSLTAPSSSCNVKNRLECNFQSDDYFMTQSSKSITSDNTLSRLRTPRLNQEVIPDLLADLNSKHELNISRLTKNHFKQANKWLFALRQGYSVILYGLGSKYHLLKSLHEKLLSDHNVLVVNGFFPSITIKEILDCILTQILGEKHIPIDALECVRSIKSIQLKRHAEALYLLVHNLDGPALRGDRPQTVLSQLAQVPNIHLIASVDHINSALLWDQSKLRRYNFVWWDVSSFAPYFEETSFESSLLLNKSSTLTLKSLDSVFKSLTQNAKKLFMLLAKNQLECDKPQNFTGIPFSDFYWKCREAFIASSDGALRAQLTEFVDHKLINFKRRTDGVESLIIPIESGILNQFIENYEDN